MVATARRPVGPERAKAKPKATSELIDALAEKHPGLSRRPREATETVLKAVSVAIARVPPRQQRRFAAQKVVTGILLIGVGIYVGIHGWMGPSSQAPRVAQAALTQPLGG